ncbi:acyl-CoA thioesterase-1 [Marmoricola sp. OAE513]|uniref:SGNH/GDSL hydrolase family protein n=1 Tax=Marmoricola sp. OAE513 TaxID=2817894 RepID=UPI001AE92266
MAAAAGLVIGVLGLLTAAQPAQSTELDRCAKFANDSRARAKVVTGTGSDVVVIGDSYSVGLGLTDPLRAWPEQLPGRLQVFGFSGSGFSHGSSPCGEVAYYQRAPQALRDNGATVVIEGGLNDEFQTTAGIRAGVRRVLAAARGHRVLIVGPAKAPSRAAQAVRIDKILRAAAARSDVGYVSMLDHRFSYLPDRLHLTPAGHRAFGRAVAEALVTSAKSS